METQQTTASQKDVSTCYTRTNHSTTSTTITTPQNRFSRPSQYPRGPRPQPVQRINLTSSTSSANLNSQDYPPLHPQFPFQEPDSSSNNLSHLPLHQPHPSCPELVLSLLDQELREDRELPEEAILHDSQPSTFPSSREGPPIPLTLEEALGQDQPMSGVEAAEILNPETPPTMELETEREEYCRQLILAGIATTGRTLEILWMEMTTTEITAMTRTIQATIRLLEVSLRLLEDCLYLLIGQNVTQG